MKDINFIDINPAEDEQILIERFEEKTQTTLYPAQDARILIALMVYYANLLKVQINDSLKTQLVKFSRFPILDFLGEAKNCERLENESDESYIKRILLSPEGYSVAGPELAYKYFILSSNSDIVDGAVENICEDASVTIGETTSEFISNTVDNSIFSGTMDFENEEIEITLKAALNIGDKIKVKIPHPYKLDAYVLTKDGSASEDILDTVSNTLKDVRPICDYVRVKSAQVQNFTISGTVKLEEKADKNSVKTAINNALNSFLSQFNDTLNKGVILNQIITAVCAVDGVFDFIPSSPSSNLNAQKNINYKGEIGTLNYERTDNG